MSHSFFRTSSVHTYRFLYEFHKTTTFSTKSSYICHDFDSLAKFQSENWMKEKVIESNNNSEKKTQNHAL